MLNIILGDGKILVASMKSSQIIIAARQSDLARFQAYEVGNAIKKKFPKLKIKYCFRSSLGDQNLNNPLWKMPEKGVFTSDFVQDLIEEKADLVVHSWKDLPIENNGKTSVVATLKRADARDVFLFKKDSYSKLKFSHADHSKKIVIFSSSPRRSFNIGQVLPDLLPFGKIECEFLPVRGNIQTRIKKCLDDKNVDGIIVAKAAIDRLINTKKKEFIQTRTFLRKRLADFLFQVLPLSLNPCSAAQGALAIEIKNSRSDIKKIISKINHDESFQLVEQERKYFKSLGGGCHQKLGVALAAVSCGHLVIKKGLDQKNQCIDEVNLILDSGYYKTHPDDQIVVVNKQLKKVIGNVKAYQPKQKDAVFVTKSEGLVDGCSPSTLIWTSGVTSWRALAKRGLWVSGSFDSMGDGKRPDVKGWYKSEPVWIKLTHKKGKKSVWAKKIVTHSVEYDDFVLELPKKHVIYYWSHGELFKLAVKKQPELKKAMHACGLGQTLNILLTYLPKKQILPMWRPNEL